MIKFYFFFALLNIVFCSQSSFAFRSNIAFWLQPSDEVYDPYWNQVSVLLRCEGGVIQDLKNHTITNTNVTSSMISAKFGLESCYFNGVDARLDFATSTDYNPGGDDFTLEAWVYLSTFNATNNPGTFASTSYRFSGDPKGISIFGSYAGLGDQQFGDYVNLTPEISLSLWNHVALVRSAGVLTYYVNGVSRGSIATSLVATSNELTMGRVSPNALQYFFNGYLEEVRLTKGIARYLANFNVPTKVFPSTFSPLQLSGLRLWLDADDAATITENLGAISAWSDKSGNAYSFNQTSASNKPVLDTSFTYFKKPIVNFTESGGANRYLTAGNIVLTSNYTIFSMGYWLISGSYRVLSIQGGQSGTAIQGGSPQNTGYFIVYSAPSGGASVGSIQILEDAPATATYTPVDAIATNSRFLTTFLANGAGNIPVIRKNTVPQSLEGTTAITGTNTLNTLGSTDGLYLSNGYFAEILIYNRALSNFEIAQVEYYLNAKWNDDCQGSPSIGTVCADGSIYAGLSPDGNVKMFTTRCDKGQTWDGSTCTGTRSLMSFNNGSATYIDEGFASLVTGKSNSAGLNALTNAASPYSSAAYCESLNINNRLDWYLPARSELSVLYTNNVAIGNFNSAWRYWSSSEGGGAGSLGWYVRFSDGAAFTEGKDFSSNIRCVRR